MPAKRRKILVHSTAIADAHFHVYANGIIGTQCSYPKRGNVRIACPDGMTTDKHAEALSVLCSHLCDYYELDDKDVVIVPSVTQ